MTFQPLHVERVADNEPLSTFVLNRMIEQLREVNRERMRSCACSWPAKEPMSFGSLTPRLKRFWWPVSPEATQLKIRVVYEVLHAPVRVRWTKGDHENVEDEGDYNELAVTAGLASETFTLDITGREDRARTLLPLAFWVHSREPEAGSAVTYGVDLSTTLTSFEREIQMVPGGGEPAWTFGVEDVLGLEALHQPTAGGSAVSVQLGGSYELQVIRSEDNGTRQLLSTWPWPRTGTGEAPSYNRIKVTRYGTLKVYSISVQEVEGAPYHPVTDAFPYPDTHDYQLAVASGMAPRSNPLRTIYEAGEYLFATRTRLYSFGPRVRPRSADPSSNLVRTRFAHHVNFDLRTDWTVYTGGWQTLSVCGVGPHGKFLWNGAEYFRNKVKVTVGVLVIPHKSDAEPLPVEFRLRTVDRGANTVLAETSPVTLLFSDFGRFVSEDYFLGLWKAFVGDGTGRDTRGPRNYHNLMGLVDQRDWGEMGLTVLDLFTDDALSSPRSLSVQCRPVVGADLGTTEADSFFRSNSYTIYGLAMIAQDAPGADWDSVGTPT